MLAWLHNQKIFDSQYTKPETYECHLKGETVNIKYALGGLYYDFIKGLERFGVHFRE